jgi:hypothetical protein
LISMESIPNDDDAMQEAWTAIAGGVQISTQDDLAKALAAGADLSQTPDVLAPPGKSWYVFARHGQAEGWIYNYVDRAGLIILRDTGRRSWDGALCKVIQDWTLDTDGNKPAVMERYQCDADPLSKLEMVCKSRTTLTGVITTHVNVLPPIPEVTSPLSPSFVLSSRLPGLLSSAKSLPTALFTDRFVGVEGDLLPQPILLLIDRTDNYVQVQVNGSGQVSRWYFKPDGSLDRAEFPGGLNLEPSSLPKIAAQMGDRRLTPPS